MSESDAVLQNVAYHAQLLAGIAALDYVPPALAEQRKMLANLRQQERDTSAQIKALEKKTKKERKEHEAIRDSTARRFAAKITGKKEKFEKKQEKEEREYVEALEREMQEKRRKESLDQLIEDARNVEKDLENKLQQYELTKQDLAALYSRVFDGPTQTYPEDDRLENELANAQGRYNEIQGYMNRESQAVHLLKAANAALQGCNRDINEALGYSTWDMFGGGGVSDMMERNALSNAEGKAVQAQTYVVQAQNVSPQIKPIGNISIAHGSIISDVLFDNIFTDVMFHDKIKESQRNIQVVQYNLTNELNNAATRVQMIGKDLSGAADALTHARRALDNFRRSVFDNVAGGSLPAYSGDRGAPVSMPQPGGVPHAVEGTYAPPSGPPPLATASSYTSPAGPPPSSTSYAPPAGPPPSAPAPPTHSASAAPSSSSSIGGSRNPYAAAMVASPTKTTSPLPEKEKV